MIENGYEAAKTFRKSIFLLDRYFLTVPALRKLNQLNAGTEGKGLEFVTKAKRNCIAYEEAVVDSIKKRGRPKERRYGLSLETIYRSSGLCFQALRKLQELFPLKF